MNESMIAAALAHGLFHRRVLVVPNCGWTGSECDLLVLTQDLRIVDVEIKISRQDLKADIKKDKWWVTRPWSRSNHQRLRREWPDKCWKHYYAVKADVWHASLLATIPTASGVILVAPDGRCNAGVKLDIIRQAKPNKDAKPICPADAIDLARLASLRMWAALNKKRPT